MVKIPLIPVWRRVRRFWRSWSLDRVINTALVLGVIALALVQIGLIGAIFWSHQPPWLTGLLIAAWAVQFAVTTIGGAVLLHRTKPAPTLVRFPPS